MDRDGKFCPSFRGFLEDEGIQCKRLPAKSPNKNILSSIRCSLSVKHCFVSVGVSMEAASMGQAVLDLQGARDAYKKPNR